MTDEEIALECLRNSGTSRVSVCAHPYSLFSGFTLSRARLEHICEFIDFGQSSRTNNHMQVMFAINANGKRDINANNNAVPNPNLNLNNNTNLNKTNINMRVDNTKRNDNPINPIEEAAFSYCCQVRR